jgi:hypothetical protein
MKQQEQNEGFLRQTAIDYDMQYEEVLSIAKRVTAFDFYTKLEEFIADRANRNANPDGIEFKSDYIEIRGNTIENCTIDFGIGSGENKQVNQDFIVCKDDVIISRTEKAVLSKEGDLQLKTNISEGDMLTGITFKITTTINELDNQYEAILETAIKKIIDEFDFVNGHAP